VAGGQDEAIAVGPVRVSRIVAEESREQEVRGGRHRHRQAGVPRARLLDRVHAQHPDGVDAKAVKRDGLELATFHSRRRHDAAPTAARVASSPSASRALAVTR